MNPDDLDKAINEATEFIWSARVLKGTVVDWPDLVKDGRITPCRESANLLRAMANLTKSLDQLRLP